MVLYPQHVKYVVSETKGRSRWSAVYHYSQWTSLRFLNSHPSIFKYTGSPKEKYLYLRIKQELSFKLQQTLGNLDYSFQKKRDKKSHNLGRSLGWSQASFTHVKRHVRICLAPKQSLRHLLLVSCPILPVNEQVQQPHLEKGMVTRLRAHKNEINHQEPQKC